MKKKKEVNKKETVELIGDNEQYRVCIDLQATGNAKGGRFLDVKGLKETIEELELAGTDKMVGLVYDGTDKLEILMQNIKENLTRKKGKIDEARLVN